MGRISESLDPSAFGVTYPDRAGYRENTTSRDAAKKADGRAGALRSRILELLMRHPAGLTSDETATMLGETVLSVRPRFSELRQLGHVERTGERRQNASGLNAHVFRARS